MVEYKEDELWKCETIENEAREREHIKHLAINYKKEKNDEYRKGFNWGGRCIKGSNGRL